MPKILYTLSLSIKFLLAASRRCICICSSINIISVWFFPFSIILPFGWLHWGFLDGYLFWKKSYLLDFQYMTSNIIRTCALFLCFKTDDQVGIWKSMESAPTHFHIYLTLILQIFCYNFETFRISPKSIIIPYHNRVNIIEVIPPPC